MSTMTPTPPAWTVERLLELPGDNVDRDLIRGELREEAMTRRNRWHSLVEILIGSELKSWLEAQPEPRGQVVGGEAGFRLGRDPDTFVGIDVAYVSAEVAAREPEAPFFEGPPVLAVEILSPHDTTGRIEEKIAVYLECGVALVWIAHPKFETVTVYRPDAPPALFNHTQELTAEPHLPGFRAPVAKLFHG